MRGCVIEFLVLGLVLIGCGNKDGVSTTATTGAPTTTTAAGTLTTSATTGAPTTTTSTAPGSALEWARVAHDRTVFGGVGYHSKGILSVTAGGPGLVAVGYDSGGTGFDAGVWVSADGHTWTHIDDEAVFGGRGDQEIRSVVAGGPGLVAVGSIASGGDRDAAVWESADGYTWRRVDDQAALGGPGAQSMTAVVAGGPGLVAVGNDGPGNGLDGDVDGAVWESADGIIWTRVPHDEAVFSGEIRSVTLGGPGLVAVGWVASNEDRDAAVWVSLDGYAWSRVGDEAVFGGPGYQWMTAVVVGGPGLVAVGYDGSGNGLDGDAAVWVSPDGYAWSRVDDEAVFGGPGQKEIMSVVAGGPGLVAVGSDSAGDGDVDAAVWESTDGIVWTRVPHDEAVFGGPDHQWMHAVVVGGPGLVAVGRQTPACGDGACISDAAVWVASPSRQ